MEIQKSKVYVLLNDDGYITRVDGGYTIGNITDPENWVLIDEGTGDRYNLCQGNYFSLPIYTEGGAYRYKLVKGKPVECTAEEISTQEEEIKASIITVPTAEERIAELEAQNEMLLQCVLEMSETVYA